MRNYISFEDWKSLGDITDPTPLPYDAEPVTNDAGYEPTLLLNAMPCSYPNPEDILIAVETSAECRWHLDLNIESDLDDYVTSATNKAYA